jgi:hypothetical protein
VATLPEPAATAFAVAGYMGLRHGEIQGLLWENYEAIFEVDFVCVVSRKSKSERAISFKQYLFSIFGLARNRRFRSGRRRRSRRASTRRLRARKDECGELITPGKYGHIFDYADGERFGILLEDKPQTEPSRANSLLARRRKALAAGFRMTQSGDCESVLLFDPQNEQQVRLSIALVQARHRKTLSPDHKAKLVAAGHRFISADEITSVGVPSGA